MNPLLADLISDAKTRLGYSYESMSKACGGVPGAGRLHQLATKPLRTFPDPDTINGLARGCKVSPLDIIKASARSLGINVSDDDRDQVRIPGFDNLPPTVRDTFRDLGLQVGELAKRAGDGDGKATPHTDAGGTPATGADDGLGAFGGRARGDLDHESINDGADDNIRQLGERRQLSAERLAEIEELQHLGDSASDDDIEKMAAWDPEDEN